MEKTGASSLRAVRIFSIRLTELQAKRCPTTLGLRGGILLLWLSFLPNAYGKSESCDEKLSSYLSREKDNVNNPIYISTVFETWAERNTIEKTQGHKLSERLNKIRNAQLVLWRTSLNGELPEIRRCASRVIDQEKQSMSAATQDSADFQFSDLLLEANQKLDKCDLIMHDFIHQKTKSELDGTTSTGEMERAQIENFYDNKEEQTLMDDSSSLLLTLSRENSKDQVAAENIATKFQRTNGKGLKVEDFNYLNQLDRIRFRTAMVIQKHYNFEEGAALRCSRNYLNSRNRVSNANKLYADLSRKADSLAVRFLVAPLESFFYFGKLPTLTSRKSFRPGIAERTNKNTLSGTISEEFDHVHHRSQNFR